MNAFRHLVWALLGAAACGHSPPPPTQPSEARAAAPRQEAEPPPAPEAAEPLDLAIFMPDHFAIAAFARDAVIEGDLERLREPTALLANYDYAEVAPGYWLPGLAAMQQAARLTSVAADLERAAAGVAAMAAACGNCHQHSDRGPSIVLPRALGGAAESESLGERMLRHMEAADLMWTGLAAPSDAAWKLGADALAAAPAEAPRAAEPLPEDFVAALSDLRALGQRAQDASTLEQRVDLYGLLIAGCARCHERAIAFDF